MGEKRTLNLCLAYKKTIVAPYIHCGWYIIYIVEVESEWKLQLKVIKNSFFLILTESPEVEKFPNIMSWCDKKLKYVISDIQVDLLLLLCYLQDQLHVRVGAPLCDRKKATRGHRV